MEAITVMEQNKTRRNFIKQGLTTGTTMLCCCAGFSCKVTARKTESPSQPFDNIGYCSFACTVENCKTLAATKNNDLQAKAKIAERWRKQSGTDVKPEDVACFGCKTKNKPIGYYAQNCDVRKCAHPKNVITCAHCDDFPTCEKETWTRWPKLRQALEKIRNELHA
jgi:hypothetical protein